jgi:hypothetical protein
MVTKPGRCVRPVEACGGVGGPKGVDVRPSGDGADGGGGIRGPRENVYRPYEVAAPLVAIGIISLGMRSPQFASDSARSWLPFPAPSPKNASASTLLRFHPGPWTWFARSRARVRRECREQGRHHLLRRERLRSEALRRLLGRPVDRRDDGRLVDSEEP